MQPQTKPTRSVPGKARDTLVKILDHVLRDECSLSAATREYRWKVTGPNLYSLHRLFDEQRRQLDYWLEKVVEQTRAIGLAARIPFVQERLDCEGSSASGPLPAGNVVDDLLERHEQMAERLRLDIERLAEPSTAALLTRLLEFHETTAWMLRMVSGGSDKDRRA